MLFDLSFEASLGLSDVDFSACAWYIIYHVRLFSNKERVFDHRSEGRARVEHHSDVVVPDPFTNACCIASSA